MRLTTTLDFFILFAILIKVAFLLSSIADSIALRTNNIQIMILEPKFRWIKERTEFIFTICMAILMIIYFWPGTRLIIGEESRLLFFVFGIVLLFTANYSLFFFESPFYKLLASTFVL